MTGASGFIGRRLSEYLRQGGHVVVPLARTGTDPKQPSWNLDNAGDADALIHLAGENIAQRWNSEVKQRIYLSRVRGTEWLCRAVANRCRMLISASGIAYYGNRGDEMLDEDSGPGAGFLAKVTQDWEGATKGAGMRVVPMRIGMVLHPAGGALAKMLPLFRAGLGGRLGSGKQYWSWIALPDLLAAIEFLLEQADIPGPVNMVGPDPITNKQFTKTMGAALRRPTVFAAPAFALRMMVGEMADEALLASVRVLPGRLTAAGFAFKYPELKPALEALLLDHAAA